MNAIITGSVILSVLHAAIPNHWLPVIAIGRRQNWSMGEVTSVTLVAALAHGTSTVLIGLLLSVAGSKLSVHIEAFTHWIAPAIFIVLGIVFIYRHHVHKHFQPGHRLERTFTKRQIIITLSIAMFFSPCMEIEAFFLMAGAYGFGLVFFIAAIYLVITVVGMVLLVRLAYRGLLKLNWHRLEHNAGIITGVILVLTGVVSFFIY